ncbi:MAG: hypothetical protein U0169_21470 [Polyangiaceae bacterium]
MDRRDGTGNARFAWPTPARSVALAGEIGDWQNHAPFRRQDDGTFALDVRVTPGVHAYKFVVDGEWVLDGSNPRTRNRAGDVENVLVVEGTEEPLLHAAAPPFLVEDDRGGVLLRVALRREAVPCPSSFVVVWREGADLGETRTPLLRVDVEGEHDLYEVHLPTSAARLLYHFELDGRSFGRATDAEGAPTVAPSKETVPFTFDPKGVRERAPDFWGDAVVYTVFVDRFRPETDLESWGREAWSADESKRTFAEGTSRDSGDPSTCWPISA